MTTARVEQHEVPPDTLALRLVIARVYAGHHNAASAALACGVKRQTWSNWERGKPMRHAEALIPHIAGTLGVSERWLREGGPLTVDGPDDGGGGVDVTRRYLLTAVAA